MWGIAYEVAAEDREHVKEYLDYREKGGYTTAKVEFWPSSDHANSQPFQVMIYIATTDNEDYLGEASTEHIAMQIVRSVGPTGKNIEYLLNLAESMRRVFPDEDDRHLFELEGLVKQLTNSNNNTSI